MPKFINAITARTDAEWPADHPLRQVARVLTNAQAENADYLICSNAGTERLPPPPDDYEVFTTCCNCSTAIVHRASAPKGPAPICLGCWEKIGGAA
jgi:hypothetical protein